MGTQLISFRLKDKEVALLMQQAGPQESASLTAQRLVRQQLGTRDVPPDRLTALLTQVSELREQVESIKSFVDEAIDQHLSAVDELVDEAVNQHMQAELLQMRTHFDEWEQRLDRYFQSQRQAVTLPASTSPQANYLSEPLIARRTTHSKTRHPYTRERHQLPER